MSKINTSQPPEFEPINVVKKSRANEVESGKIQSPERPNGGGSDKLNFSDRAAEAAKQLDRLKELPDVRQEKVNALRQQIAKGEYNPPSETIADAIIEEGKKW